MAAIYEYGPSGEPLRAETLDSTVVGNPFRFSSKYTDTETGVIYYGRRFYSPTLGRFISRDPIEEAGGINLYAFCGNDSVNGWDRLGMDAYLVWDSSGFHEGDFNFAPDRSITGSLFEQDGMYIHSSYIYSYTQGRGYNSGYGQFESAHDSFLADARTGKVEIGRTRYADDDGNWRYLDTGELVVKYGSEKRGDDEADIDDSKPKEIVNIPGAFEKPFKTQEEAAIAALKYINPISIKDNREYSGLIFKRGKFYFYSNAIKGGLSTSKMKESDFKNWPSNVPKRNADFHTHGDYSTESGDRTTREKDEFGSDSFSKADRENADRWWSIERDFDHSSNPEYRSYIGTPSKQLYVYWPSSITKVYSIGVSN